jgi:Ni,Fe-hydrogenase III large subunit/Ni,Fe-hydrogenase III component G
VESQTLGLSRKAIVERLSKLGAEVEYEDGSTIFATVKRDEVKAVARLLYELGAYFMTCAGSDETQLRGYLALYHIFGFDELGLRVVLRVDVPRLHPSVPSIVAEVPAADWCELEARDMLGIDLVGRPARRLVLPDDWPEGVYPLRKDFRYDTRPPPRRLPQFEVGEEVGLPLGPYHPALHEPEYFEIYGRGEVVEDIVYRGFHVHRGIEKLAESERMTYEDVFYLAERICGICGFVHSSCYAQAIERAAGIEIPERAEYLRSLLLEVERLHSHLLWLGVVAHLLGYDAGFMHAWRIREKVMVAAEILTGSRKTYGINTIGGVRFDVDRDRLAKALSNLGTVKEDFTKFLKILLSVPQIKLRASGTGVLSRSEARALSVVGPVARASGLYRDIRKDYPYLAYREVSFKVPLYTEGDNLARVLVRVEEVLESIEIIKQLVDKLPGGPTKEKPREIPPLRRAVAAIEAPRGEDVHFIITGIRRPYRWRVRAPTYQNIPALRAMLRGAPLADAPLTIASIDPCFSCTDRVILCDRSSGRCRRVDLRRIAGG